MRCDACFCVSGRVEASGDTESCQALLSGGEGLAWIRTYLAYRGRELPTTKELGRYLLHTYMYFVLRILFWEVKDIPI